MLQPEGCQPRHGGKAVLFPALFQGSQEVMVKLRSIDLNTESQGSVYCNDETGEERFPSVEEFTAMLASHLALNMNLTVEEIYKDRDQSPSLVREVAAPDVGRMGIEIPPFTIKGVYDNVTYLQSLGKAQTAAAKREAEIGVAQANRDAGIREAECEKAAKIQQRIRQEEIQIQVAKMTERKEDRLESEGLTEEGNTVFQKMVDYGAFRELPQLKRDRVERCGRQYLGWDPGGVLGSQSPRGGPTLQPEGPDQATLPTVRILPGQSLDHNPN